jgi:phosphate starvation-inducible protein PhoH
VVQFGEKDVVRHNLVQQIIRAYEEYDVDHSQRGGNAANGKAVTTARKSGREREKETQHG